VLLLLLNVSAIVVPQAEGQLLPPVMPALCETVHVNVLPATLLVSAIDGAVPVQIEADDGVAVAVGFGCMVTSTMNVEPEQAVAVGVTVYLTTPSVVPVLVSVWAIVVPDELLKPVIVPPAGVVVIAAVQVNVLPLTVELSAMLVAVALQIVCEEGVADPTGIGLTVTTEVMAVPEQLLAIGVIVYVAVPDVLLLFESVWAMVVPHEEGQSLPPLMPLLCETVHVNVLPETVLVRAIDGAEPLQIEADDGVAVAAGFG